MQPLWIPSEETIQQSNLLRYTQWLARTRNLSFDTYEALWQWSTAHAGDFWQSLWEYFDIQHDGSCQHVVTGTMPRAQWFEGTRLNYAEHIFRQATDAHPAIIFQREDGPLQETSWATLRQQVASLQQFFHTQNITTGDRIAAYMPGIPEASAAFLATSGLGAVWSSCSPDFGTPAVIDRFAQIEPKILVAVDAYTYGGKTFDKRSVVQELVHALPSLQCVILLSSQSAPLTLSKPVVLWQDVTKSSDVPLQFVRVPFSHPLWILYSSGTTGLPKAIVQGHGGILLEHLKYGTFHNDFKPGERCFWYTTTGWMMWNYIHGSLLAGGTMVLYDGSPGYPDLNVLWKFAAQARIHHFGTSAGFILACIKAGIHPAALGDLSTLRSVSSTGSTLPPEGFEWIYRTVKHDLWLASMSGGTDVCSAFVGGNPTLPVYAGEIQCRALGCSLEAWSEDGQPLLDEVGEMVITRPMPSMPVYFWNDPDFKRYTESYFEMFPGIWRHGDWIQLTPRQGVIIYGRSDATLNRGGVRIGTSEIYRAVDKVKEVKDSLVICLEKSGGEFWMPLFVVMQEGIALTDDIRKKINTAIRSDYSPRHVPDEIIAVPDVPYTISGKKTETPVKKILQGKDPKAVLNTGSLKNPASMDFFLGLVKQ
ncbi:acetoacetate--CoA ligase [Parachryseolinea silvisoli]|uniref:acetoacetate--CoA ligase n=1 Tax=Parachryseolinea silvisoli TaxID=2873601 RepID=UPI0022659FA9|nr:acetoacetate--CoA ligase [Parachryseolinea silvisoli]MCD9014349.1 acetoacetate--CoA ligase [Parachryseolinea silvisoli]